MSIPVRGHLEIEPVFHVVAGRNLTGDEIWRMRLARDVKFVGCDIRTARSLPEASYIGCRIIRVDGYMGAVVHIQHDLPYPIQIVGNLFTDEERLQAVQVG